MRFLKSPVTAYLLALAALALAALQYASVRELSQTLAASNSRQQELRQQVAQLEQNLDSAGSQLNNMARMLQQANERASACRTGDESQAPDS